MAGVPAAERTTDRLEGKADIKMAEGHGDEVALYVVRATSAVSKFFVTKLVTVQETVV